MQDIQPSSPAPQSPRAAPEPEPESPVGAGHCVSVLKQKFSDTVTDLVDSGRPPQLQEGRGDQLTGHGLLQFVLAPYKNFGSPQAAPNLQKIAASDPAAMLGMLHKCTLEPSREKARQVLGVLGSSFTGIAAQGAMFAMLFTTLGGLTGLGFVPSLAVAITAIVCIVVGAMLVHHLVARHRVNKADCAAAAELREHRDNLRQLEAYLLSCKKDGALHALLLAETRDVLGQIDASPGFLLKQVFERARMPVATLGALAFGLLRSSPLGRRATRYLRQRQLLPKELHA